MKQKLSFFDRWFSTKIYDGTPESPGEELLIRANTILIDISKLIITLSTGVVGISISLKKDVGVTNEKLLIYGWIAEGLSLIFGILFLYSMVRLYIIWDKADLVDRTSTILGLAQFLTFFIGLVLMGISSI